MALSFQLEMEMGTETAFLVIVEIQPTETATEILTEGLTTELVVMETIMATV